MRSVRSSRCRGYIRPAQQMTHQNATPPHIDAKVAGAPAHSWTKLTGHRNPAITSSSDVAPPRPRPTSSLSTSRIPQNVAHRSTGTMAYPGARDQSGNVHDVENATPTSINNATLRRARRPVSDSTSLWAGHDRLCSAATGQSVTHGARRCKTFTHCDRHG